MAYDPAQPVSFLVGGGIPFIPAPPPGGGIAIPSSSANSSGNTPGALLSLTGPRILPEGQSGTTAFTFTVTRGGDLASSVSANWSVLPGSGSAVTANDFVGGVFPSGTVSFASGETTKMITVQVQGDTAIEADEFFFLQLSAPSSGATISPSPSLFNQIINDDGAILALSGWASLAEGYSGTTPFTFTVTRGGDLASAVSADWSVSPGPSSTVTANDFAGGVLPSGTVRFASGETTKMVTVQVQGDSTIEADESFSLRLSAPSSGATISASSSGFGQIINDDGGDAFIRVFGLPNLAEGHVGTTAFTFTAARSGNTSSFASAHYAVVPLQGESTVNAADFLGGVFPTGLLNFEPGQTSKAITIHVQGDTQVEPEEAFSVVLSSPTTGTQIGGGGFGTIRADDGAIIDFGYPSSWSVVEGNSGTTPLNITLTRAGDISIAASASWTVAPDEGPSWPTPAPADAADFAGGIFPSGRVEFAIGETSKVIVVNVAGDEAFEQNERFAVLLSAPSAGAAVYPAGYFTISNDDAPTISFANQPFRSALEGGVGASTAITFDVQRSGSTAVEASANWAVTNSGTATATDFLGGMLPSGTVRFGVGETTQTITINVAGDTTVELDETLTVSLSNPSALAVIGASSFASATIANDDGAILNTTIISGSSVNEGNLGNTLFPITITRTGDLTIPVTATWSVLPPTFPGLNAPDAADFAEGALPSGQVSFGIGETSKVITLRFAGDTVFEQDESFMLSLTNLSAGAFLGSAASYRLTNDDGALIAFANQPAPRVVEGNPGAVTPMIFNVQRSGDTATLASINWAVDGFSATADDFAGRILPSGVLTFAPGETLKSIIVNIAGDSAREGSESVNLRLSNPSSNTSLTGSAILTGTINDDDPSVTSILATSADKAEGSGGGATPFVFTVTRDGDVTQGSWVTWSYSTANLGGVQATGALDFVGAATPAGGGISFAPGETSQTITINVNADDDFGPDERFAITLSGPVNTTLGQTTAFATIRNDDLPWDGTSGNDRISAGVANDMLRGFAGNDSLEGALGDDTLQGGDGADQLTGGPGADRFVLAVDGSARSTLASMDVLLDFDKGQRDVLTLGGVNGTLTLNDVNRALIYNADTGIFLEAAPLLGQQLPAQFYNIPTFQAFWLQGVDAGGVAAARGWIVVDVDGDEVLGASDFIAEVLGALSGRDLSFPTYEWLSDVQRGPSLFGPLGSNGNDTLTGTGRGETLTGTIGNDVLNGGAAAFNTLSYFSFTTPISVTLTGVASGTVVKNGGAQGTDSFTNFQAISGGSGNDSFSTAGLTLNPFFSGGLQPNGGNDTVTGGFTTQDDGSSFANAVVIYQSATAAPASINLATGTATDGLGGTDTLINIRRLALTGSGNDSVTGSAFSDDVSSSANGSRNLDLGAGTGDRWQMASNSRDAQFGSAINRVEVELGTGSSGGEFSGVARKYTLTSGAWTLSGTDVLRGVEQVNGSIGNDLIIGSDAANRFFGGEGNDTINGGLGLDLVMHDSFTGGSSLAEMGVTVNLTTGIATDAWGFTDTLISIENVNGTKQADDLTGVAIADTRTFLRGLTSNDVLRAPTVDTLITADYRGDRDAVTVNLGTGLATDGWGDTDRLVNIQSVIGSRFTDHITGGARNDLLEGGAGDDSLIGGAGTDIAVFTGARADYTITRNGVTNALTVTDNSAGRDGTDILSSDIETLRFGDGDVLASAIGGTANTFLAITPLSTDTAEGNTGTTPFTFTVTRTGDTSGASTANWGVTGNGASASDFTGNTLPSGTVSFAAGQTSQVVTVNVAGDNTNEGDEGFTLTLSAPTGATLGTASAAAIIRDDDMSIFSIAALSADKAEGNSGATAFTFTISRTGNLNTESAVTFTVTGSGTNPANTADFNAGALPAGIFNFAVGQSSGTLTINVLGDSLFEPAEGFTVTLSTTNPNLTIATASATALIGNDDPLTITGTAGRDTLIGTDDLELLLGLGDNDVLDGGGGTDTLDGGAGNDTLLASAGADVLNGGTGSDTLVFGPAFGGVNVTVNLASGLIIPGSAGGSIVNIENVTGNSGNDSLTGDGLINALNGGAGNDTLTGGLGNDTLNGGLGLDRFVVDAGTDSIADLGMGGADVLVVSAGASANASLAGAWAATAASANDGTANLTAHGFGADLALATGASRWFVTNAGNATGVRFTGSVSADVLAGGEGSDTLLGGDGSDTLSGNGGTDSLAGGLGNDSLNGGAGNDTLLGEANDDSLTGGAGDDRLTGGAGVDRFGVDAGTDTITDLGLGGADVLVISAGATANATLAANWLLTAGNSQSGAANITAAGFNADLTLAAGSAGWAVSNFGATRAVSLTGSARNDTLTGGIGHDTLNGGSGNDSLLGDAGNDNLTGGSGNDTMTGGSGVDRFVVDAGTDSITDLAAGGNDLLVISAGAVANATLVGAWTASSNVANAGQVNLTAAGFGVNLSAATGVSTGLWSVTNAGQATAVVFTGSGLRDRLTGGLGQNSLSGGLGDDTLTGGEARDTLSGGAGVDSLVGGASDDLLTGGADLDRFLVESGTDTITDLGLGGTDALIIQAGATANATLGGHWVASAGTSNAGSASVFANGFNLDLSATGGTSDWALSNAGVARGISLVGSANADTITGGTGVDTIRGGAGADSLNGSAGNDQLFGGAGNDTMTGGAGIDRFAVDSGTDVITDLAAGGMDVLIVSGGAAVQATLAAGWVATSASSNVGVAQLVAGGFDVNLSAVLGTAGWNVSNAGDANAVVFTGSARADELTGGLGADTLSGGAGNDTLIGGGGHDRLIGGLGADSFVFGSAGYATGDVITDFSAARGDKLDFRLMDADVGVDGDQAFTFLGAGAFTGAAGQLRFGGGVVTGDINGDGLGDFQVALTGVASLAATDLWL
jgi:Ca2+-binding RTX toxin-like protein